jgi:hypothetical protein
MLSDTMTQSKLITGNKKERDVDEDLTMRVGLHRESAGRLLQRREKLANVNPSMTQRLPDRLLDFYQILTLVG